jgi:hypothetical protein
MSYSHILPFRPVPFYPFRACQDYRDHRADLETIDDVLIRSGLDDFMLQRVLDRRRNETPEQKAYERGLEARINYVRSSFRVNILRAYYNQEAVRKMAIRLGDSPLDQWFCFVENFDQIKAPAKSSIDRFKNIFTEADRQAAFQMLLQKGASSPDCYDHDLESAVNLLGLEMPVNLLEAWYDSTCMSVNIHFPVDWVQLGDCCRSLLTAVRTIRKHGIKNRMQKGGSDYLLRQLNQLLIALGNARRRVDSKKLRKKVLRKLKKFSNKCAHHAREHKELLQKDRERLTELSEAQANLIIQRLDTVLELLPLAKKQAHERIIGERRVPTADKILSIHEPDINVIVRGKSAAEVEYGNQLTIGENRDGLVTFYELYEDVKNDSNRLIDAIDKTQENVDDLLDLIVGDRGYSDQKLDLKIKQNYPNISNHICPKSTTEMNEKKKDAAFRDSQKRRASTEARIAILTNNYQRGRSLSKGIESQRVELDWVMLTHNLRVFSRLRRAEAVAWEESKERERKKEAA